MPKVSVCLPVYNGERFLAQAIESVLCQSEPDFELLIADDCSTDQSAEIARKYADSDQRVKLFVNERNLGLFANYNNCLSKASGEFIKPFAQDDLFAPGALKTLSDALSRNSSVKLVSCGRNWIDDKGVQLDVVQPFSQEQRLSGADVIRHNFYSLTNWVGEPSTVMFRRADQGDGFDCRFYHFGDIEYWFRIVEPGDYLFLPDVLCSFRRHGNSSTTANLAGLYFALDMLLIGKKYQRYSAEIGESEQHFRKRALELAARQMDELAKQGLSVEDVIALQKGSAEQQSQQLAAFKELSFQCLRYMSELLAECHHLRCSITDYDEIVQEVRANRFWRLTRPLRQLSNSKVPVVDPDVPKVSSGRPIEYVAR